jgi:hypothetical protein
MLQCLVLGRERLRKADARIRIWISLRSSSQFFHDKPNFQGSLKLTTPRC